MGSSANPQRFRFSRYWEFPKSFYLNRWFWCRWFADTESTLESPSLSSSCFSYLSTVASLAVWFRSIFCLEEHRDPWGLNCENPYRQETGFREVLVLHFLLLPIPQQFSGLFWILEGSRKCTCLFHVSRSRLISKEPDSLMPWLKGACFVCTQDNFLYIW